MIDKTSKYVLSYILNLPDCVFDVNRDSFPRSISRQEFMRTLEYLSSEGYLAISRLGTNQAFWKATLTHKDVHPKEFNSIALKRYLLDKWIDLMAPIISIFAFIGAYRHEISEVLRVLGQALRG